MQLAATWAARSGGAAAVQRRAPARGRRQRAAMRCAARCCCCCWRARLLAPLLTTRCLFHKLPTPPPPAARNAYSALVGLLLLYFPFGSGVLHCVVTSWATYFVMWLIPKKCGTLAWLINFPYLLVL